MELLLRLSSLLPREIASEAFFWICYPTETGFVKEFFEACEKGKSLLIEQWIFYGLADISINYNYPILLAAKYGHISVVSLLLEHGADPMCRDNLPIIEAAANGHPKVVSLLLAHGADPSARDNLPLYWARRNGHLPVVSLLLDHGAKPTTYDIITWEEEGDSEIISLLQRRKKRLKNK